MMRDLSLYCSAKFTIPDHCNPCWVSFAWNAAWLIVPQSNDPSTRFRSKSVANRIVI